MKELISRIYVEMRETLVQLERVEVCNSHEFKLHLGLKHFDDRFFHAVCNFQPNGDIDVWVGDSDIQVFEENIDVDYIAREIAQQADYYYQVSYDPNDWGDTR